MSSKRNRRRGKNNGVHRRTAPGASPGTLLADPQAPKPAIHALAYGPADTVEKNIEDTAAVRDFLGSRPVTWINVDGLGDASVIERLGEIFSIHRLALEDVLNVHQRAKVDQYDEQYFIVGRMVDRGETLGTEQLSMFLGCNYVLTFQERPGDCFEPVRERIRKKGARIRQAGADYLAYALLDAFIDDYFPVLEECGERLEALEDEVIARPDPGIVVRIHQIKRELLILRRAVWPLRETISSLVRDPSSLITPDTRVYLRDCYDHTIQLIDMLENYRDIASSLMEVYLSSVSNRLNEVMKFLTIFTTIFAPLTFIAGIYGMNFHTERSPMNMPELTWYWGYPFALLIMVSVALFMLFYFRRKGWLGTGARPPDGSPGSSPSEHRPQG